MRNAVRIHVVAILIASLADEALQLRADEKPPAQKQADAAPAVVEEDRYAKAYREAQEQSAERARDYAAVFTAAAKLSVEARLRVAARVTKALHSERVATQVPQDGITIPRSNRGITSGDFLRQSQFMEFISSRPWWNAYRFEMDYSADGLAVSTYRETNGYVWPTSAEAAELRRLLKSDFADTRALAAEALATLRDPEGVKSLFELLDDTAVAPPVLSGNIEYRFFVRDEDPVIFSRYWEDQRVCDYARRGLRLMTGIAKDIERHPAFAVDRTGSREQHWYWQERFQHELFKVANFPYGPSHHFPYTVKEAERRAITKEQLAKRRKELQQELATMPPEVEAKVRLLAVPRQESEVFFDDPVVVRVSKERLFELLAKENLWQDVDWKDAHRQGHGILRQRILLSAENLFAREDVPRLKSIFADEMARSQGYSGSSIYLGLSRLLPPAGVDQLNDHNTRDGWLRFGIESEKDVFSRADLCAELVRIGLPNNATFVTEKFFGAAQHDAYANVQDRILRELAAPPLSVVKRDLLVALVLDPRFEGMLKPHQGWYWHYARFALNAHAKRVLFDTDDRLRLRPPEITKIRAQVSDWMVEQEKAP